MWWLLLIPVALVGACILTFSNAPPPAPVSTPHLAPGKCYTNADCTGGLVCVVTSQGGSCQTDPNAPARSSAGGDPHTNLCPHAAKRVLDKAYNCGFSTIGLDEASLCTSMSYDRLIYLESLNCREMQNLLVDVTKAK
jgi:hypothetical protein